MCSPLHDDWLKFCRDQSEDSFEPIYRATHRRVYAICRRIVVSEDDAREAFQSAYARLVALAIEGFDIEGEGIAEIAVRLAVREAENLRKRRARRQKKEIAVDRYPDAASSAPTPADETQSRERIAGLQALVATLPDRYRVPVLLHYFDGMTHAEIARALGRSESAVSKQISRALKQLRPLAVRAGLGDMLSALAGGVLIAASADSPAAFSAAVVLAEAKAAIAAGAAVAAGIKSGVAAQLLTTTGGVAVKTKIALISAGVLLLIALGLYLSTRGNSGISPRQTNSVIASAAPAPVSNSQQTSIAAPGAAPPQLPTTEPPQESKPAQQTESSIAIAPAANPPEGPMQSFPVSVVWADSNEGAASAIITIAQSNNAETDWKAEAATDALGGAFVDFPAAWTRVQIEAKHEAAIPFRGELDLPIKDQPYLIKLIRGRRVFGTVMMKATGAPAPGAKVVGYDSARLSRNWEAISDDAGNYELVHDADEVMVVASLGSMLSHIVTAEIPSLKIAKGQRYGPHNLALGAGLVVSGVVRDSETKLPVEKATVATRAFNVDRTGITDASGLYRIEGLYDRILDFEATAQGYATGRGKLQPLPGRENKLDIEMDPSGIVEIAVVDQDGAPAAGAEIWGMDVPISGFLDIVDTTDEQGKAVYSGGSRINPPGLSAKKSGYDDSKFVRPTFSPGATRAEITLEVVKSDFLKDGWFAGLVADSEGSPIPNARVYWEQIINPGRDAQETRTNSQGAYRLLVKPEGREIDQRLKRLAVSAEGWAPQWLERILPGTEAEPFIANFVLEPAHWIAGESVDPEGKPISGLSVYVELFDPTIDSSSRRFPNSTPQARTDTSGRFRIEGLPNNPLSLSVAARGWSDSRLDNAAVDTSHRIVVHPVGKIRGIVLDGSTGTPIDEFNVKLTSGHGYDVSLRGLGQTFVTSDGRFELTGLTHGSKFGIAVEAESYLVAEQDEVEASADPKTPETIVRLRRGEPLRGIVADPEGNPVAGAAVYCGVVRPSAVNASSGYINLSWDAFENRNLATAISNLQEATTALDGSFTFDQAPEDVTLFVRAQGFARFILLPSDRQPYERPDGVLYIPLAPGARVRGSFVAEGYDPKRTYFGLSRNLTSPGGDIAPLRELIGRSEIIDQWDYVWNDLAPGEYALIAMIHEPSGAKFTSFEYTAVFNLNAGEDRLFNLGDSLGNASLSGTIVNENGGLVTNSMLKLFPLFPTAVSQVIFYGSNSIADAEYRIDFLPPGRYRAQIIVGFGIVPDITAPPIEIDISGDTEHHFTVPLPKKKAE